MKFAFFVQKNGDDHDACCSEAHKEDAIRQGVRQVLQEKKTETCEEKECW